MRPFLFAIVIFAAAISGAAIVDGVAARVGETTILRSEVIAELQRAGAPAEDYSKMLNEMVEHKLVLLAALNSKMTMQEWVIENRIREVIERGFGGDRNKLMAMLAQQKSSYPEWRDRVREDMIVQAMRYQMVDRLVDPSPAQMRAEFEKHPDKYRSEYKITASFIVLSPDKADKKQEISDALTNEVAFADLAREFSSDAHAADGGVWKNVKPEEVFNEIICATLGKLKVGETSAWVVQDDWSYLIRKDAEIAEGKLTFDQAYDQVEENVRAELSRAAYEAWIARLRSETFIKLY